MPGEAQQQMDLCYTVAMESDQQIWKTWANYLRRWGVTDWVISTLQVAGPFAFLGSQVLHISSPFLGIFVRQDQLLALSSMLEEPVQTSAFTSYLNENRQKDD